MLIEGIVRLVVGKQQRSAVQGNLIGSFVGACDRTQVEIKLKRNLIVRFPIAANIEVRPGRSVARYAGKIGTDLRFYGPIRYAQMQGPGVVAWIHNNNSL